MTQVVTVYDQMDADRQVVILGGVPDRVKIRTAETLAVNRQSADKDRADAGLGQAFDLAHGVRGVRRETCPTGYSRLR